MTDLDWARKVVTLAGWPERDQGRDDETGVLWLATDMDDWNSGGVGDPLPCPTDPATKGCMLQSVRDAYDSPRAHVTPASHGCWYVFACIDDDDDWKDVAEGPTEWAALCAALEAAP